MSLAHPGQWRAGDKDKSEKREHTDTLPSVEPTHLARLYSGSTALRGPRPRLRPTTMAPAHSPLRVHAEQPLPAAIAIFNRRSRPRCDG